MDYLGDYSIDEQNELMSYKNLDAISEKIAKWVETNADSELLKFLKSVESSVEHNQFMLAGRSVLSTKNLGFAMVSQLPDIMDCVGDLCELHTVSVLYNLVTEGKLTNQKQDKLPAPFIIDEEVNRQVSIMQDLLTNPDVLNADWVNSFNVQLDKLKSLPQLI